MELEQKILNLVNALQMPLSDVERQCGWSQQAKLDTAGALRTVWEKMQKGSDVEYFGVVRALDFRGVFGGDLLERVAGIANLINAKIDS